MAKKFLDLEGLGIVWGKITGKITASEEKVMGEVSKKANSTDVYTKGEVNTELGKKQNTLVSGTNIRTINNQSLLDVAKGDLKVVTDLSNYYNKGQTDTAINNAKKAVKDELLDGAGEAFDTLKELSTALGNDPNFATTVSNKIGANTTKISKNTDNITKLTSSIDGHITNVSNPHQVTKDQVGLSEVDNTSDVNKPISNATKIALANKLDIVSYQDGSNVIQEIKNGPTGVFLKKTQAGVSSTVSVQPAYCELISDMGALKRTYMFASGTAKIKEEMAGSEAKEYFILDSSMALTESEINEILV